MIDTTRDGALGAIVRRRWPVVVAGALVIGACALAWSLLASDVYRATAQVFLTRTFVDASLTGTPNSTAQTDPLMMASTQAAIAKLPVVVERTLRKVGRPARTPDVSRFLSRASTDLPAGAPGMVTFIVRDSSGERAVALANAWAREANTYRVSLDTRAVRAARRDIDARLRRLERSGDTRSELYRTLVDKQQQLQTILTLSARSGTLVREAAKATTARRGPVASALLGLAAGAILGVAIAFLWELFVPAATEKETFPPRVPRRERAEEFVP